MNYHYPSEASFGYTNLRSTTGQAPGYLHPIAYATARFVASANKRLDYSYQNELRYAVSKYGNPLDVEVCKMNTKNCNPIKIKIGSIKDIAFSISSSIFLSTPIYCFYKTKLKEKRNIIMEKIIENGNSFVENYKPSVIPSKIVLRFKDFRDSIFGVEAASILQRILIDALENSPRKNLEID